MKRFKLVKNTLYAENKASSVLKIENEDYTVSFIYLFDYVGDLKKDELDMMYLNVAVKRKAGGDGMPMVYSCTEDDLFVNLLNYPDCFLDDNGAEKMICRLQKAQETKKELLGYIHMIARGEFIDVEKEFD